MAEEQTEPQVDISEPEKPSDESLKEVSEVPADATEQSEPQAILGGDETKVETEPTEIAGTDGANVEDAAPPPPAENASGESENPVEGEVEATAAPSEPNTTQSAGEEAPAEGAPAEGGEAAAGPQPAAATEATTEAPADGAEAPAPADGTAAPVEGEPVSAEETPASTEAAPSDPAAPSATTEVAGEEPSVSRSDLVPGTVPAPEEVTGLETVPEDAELAEEQVRVTENLSRGPSPIHEEPQLERLETHSPTDLSYREDSDVKIEVSEPVPNEADLARKRRDDLLEQYRRTLQQKEQAQQYNQQLQHRIAEYFRRKRAQEQAQAAGGAAASSSGSETSRSFMPAEFEKASAELEQRYVKYMETIEVLREQLEDQHAAFLKDKDNVKRRCDELRERADLELDELLTDLRALAACAVSSRTGRTMQPEEVETQLAALKRKEEEVAQLRLQYIKLKNRYTKEDEALRSKEELGEGLHMIDFEQLKIENQTYNEKIEERNEELQKLRKKITNTVQIMTHLKEKSTFLELANVELKKKLEALDEEVAAARDRLSQTKKHRDRLRIENVQLRTDCGLLGHDELLRDMELVVDEHASERSRLERLQLEHAELSLLSGSLQKKIEQVSAAASVAVPGATAALPGSGAGRDGLLPPLALTPGPAQASSRGGAFGQPDKNFSLPKL